MGDLKDYKWVAKKCGVHEGTVRKWVMRGQIPAIRLAGIKSIRFDDEQIDQWLKDSQIN